MTPPEYILDPRFECIESAIIEGDEGKPEWLDDVELTRSLAEVSRRQRAGEKIKVLSHDALFGECYPL